ncbi:MAG: FkbM family methyltransferase [Acidobacteriota bacterium]|nr:FkbM family methyltransferase [Acidobacteriota bacterium]
MKSIIKMPLRGVRRLLAARRTVSASPPEVERAEEIFYIKNLRDGMTVFDVGANVGEMTLLFSRYVGTGSVHAFEPSQECFTRLAAVCDATKRRNVVLNRRALAKRPGTLRLHVYDEDHLGWNSLAERPLGNYGIHIPAPTIENVCATTVDVYCEENRIRRVDLLKIDVEGAEYQVLLGARRMLRQKAIRRVVFEFGQATFDMGNEPRQIELYLQEMGYRLRNIVPRDPVFPGRAGAATARFSMHVATPAKHFLDY